WPNCQASPAALAIVILLYTLAAYTPRRITITGLAICLVGSAAGVARWMPAQMSLLSSVLVGSIMFGGPSLIAWVFGDSMRYRRGGRTQHGGRAGRGGGRRAGPRGSRPPPRRDGGAPAARA